MRNNNNQAGNCKYQFQGLHVYSSIKEIKFYGCNNTYQIDFRVVKKLNLLSFITADYITVLDH